MPVPGTSVTSLAEASPARAYTYLLGGKDNFEADRRAVAAVEDAYGPPGSQARQLPRQMAARNRQFLDRAVTWAARQGIRQFLDLGAGLPVPEPFRNIHEAAGEGAATAYVDNDPAAARHGRLTLRGPGVSYAEADLRDPAAVLAHPDVAEIIDPREPAAVVLGMVLQFASADEAREIAAGYAARLAPGSLIVVSSARWEDPALWERVRAAYPLLELRNHSPAVLEQVLGGLELVRPGIGAARGWQPGWAQCPAADGPAFMLAGVGRGGLAVTWRAWLAFAGAGCVLALAYRSDWPVAAMAAGAILAPVLGWVRDEFAATRRMMRGHAEMSAVAASCRASTPHRSPDGHPR